jgi:hypothetical protein
MKGGSKSMAEKNILAYFHSEEEARGAEAKIQALRAVDTSIDRIQRFPGVNNQGTMNPLTGNISSLGDMTQNADFSSKSASIMAAADVTASGMSDGGAEVVTGRDVLLTAVMEESAYEQALSVVEEYGGLV